MPNIGAYIHIPFCSFCCHYCDFAKTAHFDAHLTRRYFQALLTQLRAWKDAYIEPQGLQVSSIYFGGGTPGLFTEELAPLLECLLASGQHRPTEITLEANPSNITPEALQSWRQMGINRVSVGVQTFQAAGLEFLKRDHGVADAQRALQLAQEYFDNVNLDLIYGWQGQTEALWQKDLEQALALSPAHISLYNLTYNPQTPIGRRYLRGKIEAHSDPQIARYYEISQQLLGSQYQQEEVSNWHKPGFAAQHNALYWQNGHYVGVGLGAHGHLPTADGLGQRYKYAQGMQAFCELAACEPPTDITTANIETETRTQDDFLLEILGAGLRCTYGADLSLIERVSHKTYAPSPAQAQVLADHHIEIANNRIFLPSQEWIRETAWCLFLADCFINTHG